MGITNKQSGTFILSPPDTLEDITIDVVADMEKTIVVCQIRADGDSSNDMRYFGISCSLTSTSNIRFQRHFGNIVDVEIHWQVIETNDFTVQRGTHNIDTQISDITISTIDELDTISTVYTHGGAYPTLMHDGLVRSIIDDVDNLKIVTSYPNASNYAHWQVVTVPGSTVQKAEDTVGYSSVDDFTISAVDTSKAVLIHDSFSYSSSTIIPAQIRNGRIYDSTNVRMSAYSSGYCWCQFYVLEHDGFSVQRGYETLSASYADVAISAVDTNKAFGNLGGQYGSWQTTDTSTINFQRFAYTNTFNSGTSIKLARDSSVSSGRCSWEVIEVGIGVIADNAAMLHIIKMKNTNNM